MAHPDLVAYRERNGLTQADLATLLGVSQGHLSKIESGLHRPGLKLRERMNALVGRDGVSAWTAQVEAAAKRSPEFRDLVEAALRIMRIDASR